MSLDTYCRQALSGLLLLAPVSLFSQTDHPLSWKDYPVLHTIPDSLKSAPAVYILEERAWEMKEARKTFEMYRSRHFIIHLNDEKGVESFNTFQIPTGGDRRMISLKARSILKDGRTVYVGMDKVKLVKDEDGIPQYLLAMEGLEPGAEVELLSVEQRSPSMSGSEVFQMGVPCMEARLRLTVPDKMVYDSKGYNGFPGFTDSISAGKHFYTAKMRNLGALESESYSRYLASLERIDYKLSYAGKSSGERTLTWDDLAAKLRENYKEFTGKELKVAAKVMQQAGVRSGFTDLEKVHAIEDHLKRTITLSPGLDDERARDFSRILDKGAASENGLLKLFTACLSAAEIPFEVGVVANRYRFPMDEQLEIWDHLDDYVLYLPTEKSYLVPTYATYRHPVLPHTIAGSKGIFTRTVRVGSLSKVEPDIRTIPQSGMEDNRNSVTASVSFNGSGLEPEVEIRHAYYGSSAAGLRPGFVYLEKDKEKQLVQDVIGLSDKPEDMSGYAIRNAAFSNYSANKPLELSCNYARAPRLMEKAGPKYLFRIGALIGRQAELYQDEKRMLPVEIEFPHVMPRTLTVRIPDGYRVSNPESLRMKVLSGDPPGQERFGFVSDYRQNGQELIVDIREFYKEQSYPLSEYGQFRKVINAAADFSKVVLVFEKI